MMSGIKFIKSSEYTEYTEGTWGREYLDESKNCPNHRPRSLKGNRPTMRHDKPQRIHQQDPQNRDKRHRYKQ
jgi:hypothetical protein